MMPIFQSSSPRNELSSSDNEQIDFNKVPIRALKISSRLQLSRLLLGELTLTTAEGLARDYRGLVELMGFTYYDLQSMKMRNQDPLQEFLDTWGTQPSANVGKLIDMLTRMERQDVLDDVMSSFERDARDYLNAQACLPLQVPEVSCCPSSSFVADNPNHLSIADLEGNVSEGELTYDAYVCYDDDDIVFVRNFVDTLESFGIRLCLRNRDEIPGAMTFETYVQLISTRCKRVLIILSPAFLKSDHYEFQAKYAAGLAADQRRRMLIPILYKPCEVPLILKLISKVDFTRPETRDWGWRRLLSALKPELLATIRFHPNQFVPARTPLQQQDNNSESSSLSIHTLPSSVLTDSSPMLAVTSGPASTHMTPSQSPRPKRGFSWLNRLVSRSSSPSSQMSQCESAVSTTGITSSSSSIASNVAVQFQATDTLSQGEVPSPISTTEKDNQNQGNSKKAPLKIMTFL